MEREQEREEFQQEIQRLEEQLRQAARPRPRGAPDGDVSWSHDLLHSRDSGSLWLLSFILKNVFAFHVPGNDSGRSGTSRYVWSLPSPRGYVAGVFCALAPVSGRFFPAAICVGPELSASPA